MSVYDLGNLRITFLGHHQMNKPLHPRHDITTETQYRIYITRSRRSVDCDTSIQHGFMDITNLTHATVRLR